MTIDIRNYIINALRLNNIHVFLPLANKQINPAIMPLLLKACYLPLSTKFRKLSFSKVIPLTSISRVERLNSHLNTPEYSK